MLPVTETRYSIEVTRMANASENELKFKPTLFVRGESDWKTLDNHPVKPMQFESMRDATDFTKQFQHVPYCKDIWYNKLYASIYY